MTSDASMDRLVAHHAWRHLGLITSEAARWAGLTRHQVQTRVRAGRWDPLARGVFVLAGAPPSAEQRVLAACLAGPDGTVASHASAAHLFGLGPAPPVPHVTVSPTDSARNPLAVVHRTALPRRERTKVGPVPSTMPARTLVDLATVLDSDRLAHVVDEAIVRKLVRSRQILDCLDGRPSGRSRMGAAALRAVLAPWGAGIAFESVMEVRLFRRLLAWQLPAPVGQHTVTGPDGDFIGRLDLAWPDCLVGLEYQGKLAHAPRHAAHDEERLARLAAVGWRIEEVDGEDLRPSATRVRDVLGVLLTSCS